jgi:malate dehydrogenase (oxaloacetate-decarboxylating)(NADP+)
MYIFPGIGLGSILCKARHVTDAMVEHASIALSTALDAEEHEAGLVYPRLNRIREISAKIAFAVIRRAQIDVSCCVLFVYCCLVNMVIFLRVIEGG